MRIAAFTKYGREAASTRQRLLQYFPALNAAGITAECHPLLDDDYVRALASGANISKGRVARAYGRRLRQLLRRPRHDLVWIYAELFPYLPAPFERLAFRSGRPVVYDFDDAFFEQYESKPLLRAKLEPLIAGASACCCGNEYLLSYARRFNSRSLLLPTVVDTAVYVPAPSGSDGPVTIGWIGSPSTWRYVRPLLPLLRKLVSSHGVRIAAVGAGVAAEGDRFDGLDLIEWSEASEVAQVQAMDIGIMPLPDEPWARGKSGYKLIQYMACGVPSVASPVGVNSSIVRDGRDGYLAADEPAWEVALERLVGDADLRRKLGSSGRARAVEFYSLDSQAPRLVQVLREAAGGP